VTAEGMLGMKGKGKAYGLYPEEGLWVTGFSGYQRLLSLKDSSNLAVVLTQDKAGANATFGNGVLGQAFGSPICVSEFMSEVLQATGLNTAGGGTKTAMLYVNRDAFRLGERRGLAVDMSTEFYFKTYQLAFRAVWRGHFKNAFTANSSNKIVTAGVNITTY
jgi:HK97 family phage major capsid protein